MRCADGRAAPLVVPDPRWFALHKRDESGHTFRETLDVTTLGTLSMVRGLVYVTTQGRGTFPAGPDKDLFLAVTAGRLRSHANATWARVAPWSSATRPTSSTMAVRASA